MISHYIVCHFINKVKQGQIAYLHVIRKVVNGHGIPSDSYRENKIEKYCDELGKIFDKKRSMRSS